MSDWEDLSSVGHEAPKCTLAPATDEPMDRRSFLFTAAATSLGASVFFLFATLAQALLPPSRSIEGMTEAGEQSVARLSDLELKKPVVVEYGDDRIFVIKTSPLTAVAFDTACPHARCTLAFDDRVNGFACPCHGGFFALDGRRLKGPSRRDMVRFRTRVVNGDVIVFGQEA